MPSPFKPLLLLLALLVAGPCAPLQRRSAHPALWAIRTANSTLYLFGTIHTLPDNLDWFGGAVQQAFARSDLLVLELSPTPAAVRAAQAEYGHSPTPLPQRIGPALTAQTEAALAGFGQSPHAFDGYAPWFAATALSAQALDRIGYHHTQGAEALLTAMARQAGKPVTGLESADQQLAPLAALPDSAQRRLLAVTLAGLPDTRARTAALLAAWSRGDAEAVRRVDEAELRAVPELAQAMLTQRNARWADWIARRMEQPGTVFVAVGAGHLAGPGNLLQLLAAQGLKAKRIRY